MAYEFFGLDHVDSKELFSNRVENYVKFRPNYPKEALDYLYDVVGLDASSTIADVGAGTGIFSRRLVERGSRVIAIEPNPDMRKAAEQALEKQKNSQTATGSAEATGLPDHSVDFIVCAQSFHWFDRVAAKVELHRILKPGGKVVLIWNTRLTSGNPFLEQYDQLLYKFGTDYENVGNRDISRKTLSKFFEDGGPEEARFTNRQLFDFEGLHGRLLSSSYSPVPGHPDYEPMIEELQNIFKQNQHNEKVSFDYDTEIFWGTV